MIVKILEKRVSFSRKKPWGKKGVKKDRKNLAFIFGS